MWWESFFCILTDYNLNLPLTFLNEVKGCSSLWLFSDNKRQVSWEDTLVWWRDVREAEWTLHRTEGGVRTQRQKEGAKYREEKEEKDSESGYWWTETVGDWKRYSPSSCVQNCPTWRNHKTTCKKKEKRKNNPELNVSSRSIVTCQFYRGAHTVKVQGNYAGWWPWMVTRGTCLSFEDFSTKNNLARHQ